MKLQRCSKCEKSKPETEFHIDRSRASGFQRYCKPCKRKVDGHGKKEFDGYFIVYYLPKERYIGMTKNFIKRKQRHKEKGKNIKYGFIVLKTRKMKLADLTYFVTKFEYHTHMIN
jgi:hypothetical protein